MKVFLHKIIILLAVAVFTVSCSDFLKEEPKGRLTNDLAFTQKEDLLGSVYALYWQVEKSTKAMRNHTIWLQGEDLSTHPSSNKASFREFDVMKVSDENADLTINTGGWFWLWKTVKAANFIINGVDNTPNVTAEDLVFAKGQAHYWRAWAYFTLARIWGPVPLVLTGEVDANITLSKVSEVFELIVSDLKEAEKLPVNYRDSPWALNGVNVAVNKAAAQATLAYVYMYMAGWPLYYGTEYYQLSAAKSLEVINGVENGTYYYKLYDEFRLIHSKQENLRNTEAILAIYYSSIAGTGDDGHAQRGCYNDIQECTGGSSNCRAEIGFYCDFPEGDRKEWTYAPVTYYAAKGQAFPWWSTELPEFERHPYSRKTAFTSWGNAYENEEWDHHKSYVEQTNGWSTQINQVVRLAQVYCWYAEAVGRSGQTNAKAIELLNKVRNRANGASVADRDIYPANMTPEALAEAAYHEHGWEIGCWYMGSLVPRYSDQQRMNRVKDHYNRRLSNPEYLIPNSGGVLMRELFNPTEPWSDDKMYLPYAAADKRMNPNLDNVNKFDLIK